MRAVLAVFASVACNPPPPTPTEDVVFRDGTGADSGERGTVKITEVLWSGSVDNTGLWDPRDVFVELRNESTRPLNLSGWRLELQGARQRTWRIPTTDTEIEVGAHVSIAAKDRCFPNPDILIPDLEFAYGDPFELTLRDADERLIESVGSEEAPPFAGGYDGKVSRSMERIQLLFGSEGTQPHLWHFYTPADVEVPNDDRIASGCRERTRASPGRPNSPDYSGAFASGSLE